MAETELERLKRLLDAEAGTAEPLPLPPDFYTKLAGYSQRLRRSSGPGISEATVRLIAVQAAMIQSMARDLLALRLKKIGQTGASVSLLPEERYVSSAQQRYHRRFDAFVEAIASGQPSVVESAQRSESERSTIVRFLKHTNELVGLDHRRYGPFETEDVASIPAASADLLIAGGEAVGISTKQDD